MIAQPLDFRAHQQILALTLTQLDAGQAAGQSDCGLGRLLLHIEAMISDEYSPVEVGQMFRAIEPVHSPVMTMLLDMPWRSLVNSGWPWAAIMHQVSLRRREQSPPPMDQLSGVHLQFQQFLMQTINGPLEKDTPAVVSEAAEMYLS